MKKNWVIAVLARSLIAPAALLATLCIAAGALAAQPRLNLIFILTDDQRYNTLGCTGNACIQMPNLDRLAAEGTLFTQATVTSASFTPSRVVYFPGQYERRHGVNFNAGTAVAAEAWAKSHPVLLREARYFTGFVGNNHIPIGAQGYDAGLREQLHTERQRLVNQAKGDVNTPPASDIVPGSKEGKSKPVEPK